MLKSTLHCTRCRRPVSQDDADVRFKHGEVIACSPCQVTGVIVLPTPEEKRMYFYIALTGNKLDTEIEQCQRKNGFRMDVDAMIDDTLKKRGVKWTLENYKYLQEVFYTAYQDIIKVLIRNAHNAKNGGNR